MKKRAIVASLVMTITMVVPAIAAGLLIKHFHLSILKAVLPLLANSIIWTVVTQRVGNRMLPWVHGYDAVANITAQPGVKIPSGSVFKDDSDRVWVSIRDAVAGADGRVPVLLKKTTMAEVEATQKVASV